MDYLTHIDLLIFLIAFLIIFVYYCFYLLPLGFYALKDARKAGGMDQKVSLIIAYRNEIENLRANLPSWRALEHQDLEIILVNDHSDDGSDAFLQTIDDPRLNLIDLKAGNGKKAAIEAGVAAAVSEILIFTDADCQARSEQWIHEVLGAFEPKTDIVIGYSGFYPAFGLLNLIQRYENAVNSLQNFTMILKGRAYMGVGRNLAYRSSLIEDGSIEKTEILSGDDDLLVNRYSKKGNTNFVWSRNGQTISKATKGWKSFFFQKRRQLEAGKFYRQTDRFKLALLGSSQLLFNLLFIKHLCSSDFLPIILTIFVVKIILQLILYALPMKRLGEMHLWWLTPILEIIYLPIISLIGISQYLYKVDRWK